MINPLENVKTVEVNLQTGLVTIEGENLDENIIKDKIKSVGFSITDN